MTNFAKVNMFDVAFLLAEAVRAGKEQYDDTDVIVDRLLGKLKTEPLNTPAETRTGISDRDATLASLMSAAASGIRSTLFRVTNNRAEPLAPLEHARDVVRQALDLLTNRGKSDE